MRCPHVSPGRALRVRSWAFDHAGRACSTFSFPLENGDGEKGDGSRFHGSGMVFRGRPQGRSEDSSPKGRQDLFRPKFGAVGPSTPYRASRCLEFPVAVGVIRARLNDSRPLFRDATIGRFAIIVSLRGSIVSNSASRRTTIMSGATVVATFVRYPLTRKADLAE
jgi:hypothetical protein